MDKDIKLFLEDGTYVDVPSKYESVEYCRPE